jgi:hypothetical protein
MLAQDGLTGDIAYARRARTRRVRKDGWFILVARARGADIERAGSFGDNTGGIIIHVSEEGARVAAIDMVFLLVVKLPRVYVTTKPARPLVEWS